MDRLQKAFKEVRRVNFLPEAITRQAGWDAPLPIGFGQTISQPTTVQMMLDWLEVEPGNKILDVGSGSGWTTALLAYLTGPKGAVYAVEAIPELMEFGRDNCGRLNIKNAQFYKAGKAFGLPQHAPYDRILVSAAAKRLPKELISQLKPGGKLVIPVNYDILEIEKTAGHQIEIKSHPGFVFVPLVDVSGD